jgi:hypothetical protein
MISIETLNQLPTLRNKLVYIPFKNGQGGDRIGLRKLRSYEPWLYYDEDYEIQTSLKSQMRLKYPPLYESTNNVVRIAINELNCLLNNEPINCSWTEYYQDDFVIMEPAEDDFRLICQSVFFPTGWNPQTSLGKLSTELHKNVGNDSFRINLNKSMRLLKEGDIWERCNWFLYSDKRLRHVEENKLYTHKDSVDRWQHINNKNAGDNLFIRYERQTLRLLPQSNCVLFTIRVYVDPLRHLIYEDSYVVDDFIKAHKKHKYMGPWTKPMFEYLERNK